MGKYTDFSAPSAAAHREMDEKLEKEVEKADRVFMTSKAEIVEYYRDTYKKGWKQKIIHDLARVTGMKPKSLERRFDPQRLDNPEKKNASQYKELGETLPPIGYKTPKGGYKVTVLGKIKISGEWKKLKISGQTVKGKNARHLTHDTHYTYIFDEYLPEPGMAENWDVSSVHVEALN